MAATADVDLSRPLLLGLGVTGLAVASALAKRGIAAVVVDDHPSPALRTRAQLLGVELIEKPSPSTLRALVSGCSALLPSPGVADSHPIFTAATDAGVGVLSELDLARLWDRRPIVAITGTNGKTTVTTMVTEMLEASGRHAIAAGNTEVPLVAAIDDPSVEVFVVEASSFRLGHTRRFEPVVATWLNFADDHLDVHASLAAYESAKAKIWATLPDDGVAVANADDPIVMADVRPENTTVTFSSAPGSAAEFHVDDGAVLRTADGAPLVAAGELVGSLPHDVANALAASASALHGGASIDGVRSVLRSFRALPHRVELIAEAGGVRWFDDSKATAPHATVAALRGFDSVVLIAGGRNKGLDLSPLAAEVGRVRGVVAIGEAADEVVAVFNGRVPVRAATSMVEAVAAASELARRGDAVLLSPACASFDWYGSYAERGDDFRRHVLALVGDDA
jgi:UDP-N-acetylmuramoylalanine--D-glutamate ligase